MSSAESSLRNWILGDSAIAAAVGTRYYPKLIPQDADLPAIAYQRISARPKRRRTGTGTERIRFQLTCVAVTYQAARQLAEQVKVRIDSFSTTGALRSMKWENDSDLGRGVVTDNEPVRLDVIVSWCR